MSFGKTPQPRPLIRLSILIGLVALATSFRHAYSDEVLSQELGQGKPGFYLRRYSFCCSRVGAYLVCCVVSCLRDYVFCLLDADLE